MILDIWEKALGSLCVAAMAFVVRENAPFFGVGSGRARLGFVSAIAVLLLNYLGWWLYFHGRQSAAVMLCFPVDLPPVYYVCIGLWRGNWILLVTGLAFEIVHFVHVYGNLKGGSFRR